MGFFTKRGGGRTILGAAAVLGMALAVWTVGLLGCDGGDRDDDSYDGWADPKAVVRGTLIDSRDGQEYRTVKIGTQTWMAENLNYDEVEGGYDYNSSLCYDDSVVNCDNYGRLYSEYEANSVCPRGWRLPSDKDWDTLITVTGGEKVAGKKLKSKDGWDENDGTDDYGFSALPGGMSYRIVYINVIDRYYSGVGYTGYWWTSSGMRYNQLGSSFYLDKGRWTSDLSDNNSNGSYYKFSVRCIKN